MIGERLIRRFRTVTRFSFRFFASPRSPLSVPFKTPVSRCKSLYREYFTRDAGSLLNGRSKVTTVAKVDVASRTAVNRRIAK